MILNFIYKKYKSRLTDLMVLDMLQDVPESKTDLAIPVLGKQKDHVINWLYAQASAISRRNVSDMGSLEIKHGILIEIKTLISLLNKSKSSSIEHPTLGELKPIKSETEDWKKGVENFKKGKK